MQHKGIATDRQTDGQADNCRSVTVGETVTQSAVSVDSW